MNVIAILLAAGTATRFGSDKLLHVLPNDVPIALQAARHLRAVFEDNVIVVVRPEANGLADLLQKEGCKVVVCERAAEGMGASLACGVRAANAAGTVDGYLIALADMPFIRPGTIALVRDALVAGAPLVAPCFGARRGHPVGLAAKFKDELEALGGDEGARRIISANAKSLLRIPVDDPGVIQDIDLPRDLAAPIVA